jgi:D-alanyl-D-alanine carboxypeptidase
VTGQPVREVFEQRIIEPLELSQTSFPGESAEFPEPHAQGFTLQSPDATPTEPVNATDWNPSWGWTAGGMISTASDLLVYGRALGTGQGMLTTEAQVERLTSFPGEAGYGLGIGCVDGWVGHTGELPGYNTSVFYDTTADTTVIVLANSDIPSGDCTEAATLQDNPTNIECADPATRIFVGISKAMGHTFTPPPKT